MYKNIKSIVMAFVLCMLIQYDIVITSIALTATFGSTVGLGAIILCQILYYRNTRNIFKICGVKPADDKPGKDDFQ